MMMPYDTPLVVAKRVWWVMGNVIGYSEIPIDS